MQVSEYGRQFITFLFSTGSENGTNGTNGSKNQNITKIKQLKMTVIEMPRNAVLKKSREDIPHNLRSFFCVVLLREIFHK